MAQITVGITNFKAMRTALKYFPIAMGKELNRAIGRSLTEIQRQAVINVPRDRSGLAKSAQISTGNLWGRLRFNVDYASVVHDGRRPHSKMPPTDKIEKWVNRKLGIGGKRGRSVAFQIARSIGRKGIKGRPFLQDAVDEKEVVIDKIFNQALIKVLKKL